MNRSDMPEQYARGGFAQRFQNPIPYRRDYVGPSAQMFGNIFANRSGIGSLPGARNFAGRGFQMLGQGMQLLPFSRPIGNLLNRAARPVNRGMEITQAMNPQNMMMSGIGGLFGGRREGGRGGLLGGLFGARRQPRQRRGGLLGLFGGGRRGRQGQRRGATGFSQMSPMQQFARQQYLETAGPIGPGMDMDSYGFGQSIQRPDAAGIAESVNRQIQESLPFQQIDDPSGKFYTLIDKQTGRTIMSGRHHKDYRPSYTRRISSGVGGGL